MTKFSARSSSPQPSKKSTGRLLSALLAASALTSAGQAVAQVTGAAGGPAVVTNLGVPIVVIATPDASGLSHNRYTDFSVTSRGVVLNNQAGSSGVQTQLAGLIGANPNLTNGAATKILNEVTSTNRSVINGFIEVAGSRAEVFVANPNGITCGGCGFINTGAVTLTTGVPAFANGVFQGFTVNGGDLLITGSGINATASDYLALVARSIKIDGQVNAKTLDLVAGRANWNALTRSATALASDGSTGPSFGIDSTALGGMYAGRIRLIATETGVGVRALGDVAATGADFSIDVAGKVLLANRISAANVTVASHDGDADAISATGAQLTATQALTLDAGSTGGVTLSGGVLSAGGALTLSGVGLIDTATTNAALTDNNKRAGAASTTLTFTGAAQIGAMSYGSGGALTGTFGSLTATPAGAVFGAQTTLGLSTTGGDLALGSAQVRAGTVTLAASGALTTAADAKVEATAGTLTLKGGSITSAGTISSDLGGLSILAASSAVNSGSLHSAGLLTISDQAGAGAETFSNGGTIIGDAGAAVQAASFSNSGAVQTHDGGVFTFGRLDNASKLLLGGSATINTHALTNETGAFLQSAGDLILSFTGQGASLANAGTVLSGGTLTLAASAPSSSFVVANYTSGVLQANALTFSGHGTVGTQAGSVIAGAIGGALDALDNSGQFQSTGATTLAVAGTLSNSGTLIASNSSGAAATLSAGALSNTGVIQSAGALSISGKTMLANAGKIVATGDLTVRELDATGASTLAITNASGAYLQAGGVLDITSLALQPLTLNTNRGILLGSTFAIALPTLNNVGVVQTNGGALTVAGTFNNVAGGTLTLSTAATGQGTLSAASIANAGVIQAAGGANLLSGGAVTNSLSGAVNVTGDLTIAAIGSGAGHSFSNSNTVVVGGHLTVGSQSAPSAWTIQEAGSATTAAGHADLYGAIELDGASKLSTTNALNAVGPTLTIDSGAKLVAGTGGAGGLSVDSGNAYGAAGGTATVNGLVYSPTSVSLTGFNVGIGANGGLLSNGDMTLGLLGTANASVTNAGQIYAAGDISSLGQSFSNSGSIDIGGSGNVVVAGGFTNLNHIDAAVNLRINAATIQNTTTATVVYSYDTPGFITATLNKTDTDQGRNGIVEDRTTQAYQEVNGILIKLGCTTSSTYDCHDSDQYHSTDTSESGDTYYHQYVYDPVTATLNGTYNRASITAGSTLELSGFSSALNNASSLTAQTINLYGANSNATFTNSSLQTGTLHVTATWQDYNSPSALYINFTKTITSIDNEHDYGGEIHAATLNAANFNLVNNGATNVAGPTAPSTPAATSSLPAAVQAAIAASQLQAAQAASAAGMLTFGGLSISLPSSPNGLYVVSQDPSSKYLVVTNPVLTMTTPTTTPVVIVTPPTTPDAPPTTTTTTTPTTLPTTTTTPTTPTAPTPPVDSDYLAAELGLDADRLQQRLGDAAYENYLIQQQLLAQAGASRIYISDTYAQQTQALYDQAASQASTLKLTWGAPLSTAQQAGLKTDIVWMVSTVVQGHTVLAPVVYLASATKSAFDTGATTIAANDANLQLASLTNTGGVISGAKTLAIVSTGDVTNTSGVIRGGDVSVVSTNGNIINQTATRTVDSGADTHTIIDKTASIQADTLSLDAKNNIKNTGAQIAVTGDASLKAGNNITFDTVVDKEKSTQYGVQGHDKVVDASSTNIKSGLTVGGSLGAQAGQDITFAGTDAKIAGDASLNAGRDISIVARNDTASHTTSDTSHGFLGTSTTTNEHTDATSTNVASNFSVGGSLGAQSGRDVNVVGSDVTVTGDALVVAGRDFNVKNGTNAQTSSDRTVTTGIGVNDALFGSVDDRTATKDTQNVSSSFNVGGQGVVLATRDANITGSNVSAGSGGIQAGRDVNITAGRDTHSVDHTTVSNSILQVSGSGSGSGSANADASAGASASANVGGLQAGAGANSGAGAGVDSQAGNSTYANASRGAGAGGSNPADAGSDLVGAQASASADASIGAQAQAQTNAGLALYNNTVTSSHEDSTTSKASNVTFGANGTIIAANNVNLTGSNLKAGGQLAIGANNINITAAENTHNTSSNAMSTSVGLMANNQTTVSATAGVQGSANASAGASNGSGSASAGVSAGLNTSVQGTSNTDVDYAQNSQSSRSTSDVTHTGSSVSGGSVVMIAKNDLNVIGSNLGSTGDMALGAKNMTFAAAQDTHTSTTSDRLTGYGLYADTSGTASAGAQVGASASTGASAGGAPSKAAGASAGANADAQADAGVGAQIHNTMQTTTEGSTTAQTSNINVGGSLTRVAQNAITDVGTQINVGGDLNQSSKTYTNVAAANTTTSGATSNAETLRYGLYGDAGATASANAGVSPSVSSTGAASSGKSAGSSAGAGAEAGVGASLNASGGYSNASTSQAVVSNITTGGAVNLQTSGKTSLEGTNISSGGPVILAVGSLDFKAAKNTTSGQATQQSIVGQANLGVDAETTVGGGASVNYSGSELVNKSSQAVTGSIASNGPITVQTKGNANFEGTQLASNSDVNLNVGKNLTFSAAHDTTSSVGGSQTLQAGATISGKTDGVNGQVGVQVGQSQSDTVQVGGIASNGNIAIKTGGSATLEGTQLASAGSTGIDAVGPVNLLAAKSTSQDFTAGVNLGGSFSSTSQKVDNTPTTANSTAKSSALTSGGAGAMIGAAGGSGAAANAAGTTGGGGSASTLSVNAGVNGQYDQSSTATTVGINAGKGVSIRSGTSDANLEGTQIAAGGPVQISAARDVNLKSADSTSLSAGGAIGANFGGSYTTPAATVAKPAATAPVTTVAPPGGWTTATPSANATRTASTTIGAQRGSATTGTPTLAGGGAGALATATTKPGAGGLPSGGAGAAVASTTPKAAPKATTSVDAIGGQASVNAGYASTQQGVSISGGSVDISAGRDVSATGGSITSGSQTTMNAGRNITLAAADNVNFAAGLSGSLGKGDGNSNSIGGASLSAGFGQQGMTIQSAGSTALNSGGATSLQGTQVASGGSTAVNAVGGVSKSGTVSGSASLSATDASAGGAASGVSLTGKGGVTETTGKTATAAIAREGPAVQAPPVVIPAVIGKPIVIAQPGQTVTVTTADGKPAPSWVVYNPTTGSVTATPPAGYTGPLSFTTSTPATDGTMTTQTLSFGQTAAVSPSTTFGSSASITQKAGVDFKPKSAANP